MKLIDALQTIRSARGLTDIRRYWLGVGFTPLHLGTYLQAHLQRRVAGARVELETGLFDDLVGNVSRAAGAGVVGVAVVIEWSDLDRRLGLRQAGGWSPAVLADIVATAQGTLARLTGAVTEAAARTPVALALPSLPLPPAAYTPGDLAGAFELELRAAVAAFAAGLSRVPGVRVVNAERLDAASPVGARHSVRGELSTGFPYAQTHAASLASLLAGLLAPPAPKKGLITDLDDTVWLGILGDVGVEGVRWGQEHGAQVHALYQQLVASLADAGVLVAVASKNDEALVEEAFRRPDLLLGRDRVFPLLAGWGAKSLSVDAVLQAWNVGADSLVFVDDSPLELAEVQARHPEVECLLFPKDDPDAVLALLRSLRDLFGRPALQVEDALRRESLRGAEALRASRQSAQHDEESFLSGLDATVTIAGRDGGADQRAFELLNKTNQFNINGGRCLETEWAELRERPDAVIVSIGYADKFGPLGRIAVLTGAIRDGRLHIDRWVMSCRAFARRIEHATLRAVFDTYGVVEVVVSYAPTPRNGPARDFLAIFATLPDAAGDVVIPRTTFERHCPPLYHRIEGSLLAETAHG